MTGPWSNGPERRHPQRHPRRSGPTTRAFASRNRPICARMAAALSQVQMCGIDRPGFVAPICLRLAGGHGGLDARLGALTVPRPLRSEAKPCSDGRRVTRAIVWVSRRGLGPSEERRPVSEPSRAGRRDGEANRHRGGALRRPFASGGGAGTPSQLSRSRDRDGPAGLPAKIAPTREGDVRWPADQVRVTSFGPKVTFGGIRVTSDQHALPAGYLWRRSG